MGCLLLGELELLRLLNYEGGGIYGEVGGEGLWPQLLVGDLCQADLIGDEFHSGFELSFVKLRGYLLEDDIENLKRSEGFRSEDVIEMKKNDERMGGPKWNRVKVAGKEETGKFRGSPDGGPINLRRSFCEERKPILLPIRSLLVSEASFLEILLLITLLLFLWWKRFISLMIRGCHFPLRKDVVTLIISSTVFRILSWRHLMSSGFVIPCTNPEILMHSGAPLTSLLSSLYPFAKSSIDFPSRYLIWKVIKPYSRISCQRRVEHVNSRLAIATFLFLWLPERFLSDPPDLHFRHIILVVVLVQYSGGLRRTRAHLGLVELALFLSLPYSARQKWAG
ncbi:hypothetical protein Tco_1294763 [Tanacetum coccineum]